MNKVLIIHPEGNSFNNPTMKAIIDLLLDNDVEVTIRYGKTVAPMPAYRGVILKPWGRLYGRIKRQVIDEWCSARLLKILMLFEFFVHKKKYDLILGVDRQGVIESRWWERHLKVPYVFISFEIMFLSETSKKYKKLEIDAAKKASYWLVQDAVRAEKLRIEDNLDEDKKIILPLASRGVGVCGTERLRDKLCIPLDKKVAMMMGSLSDWTMAREIMESVADWPNEWCLIVHERYGETRRYIDELKGLGCDIAKSRIYVSSEPVDMIDSMGDILAGVSIGLVFYRPNYTSRYTGKNIKYIGFSSGKVSTFFRYGIPVIMNRIGQYSDSIKINNSGFIVQDPEGISRALSECDVGRMSNSAVDFFKKHLDFENFDEDLWFDLSNLIGNNTKWT